VSEVGGRYYEIPQLRYEDVLRDIKEGKVEGVKLQFCDHLGQPTGEETGLPRAFDGINFVWLYKGTVFRGSLGVKVFGVNSPYKFFEILRLHYGPITVGDEEMLGLERAG